MTISKNTDLGVVAIVLGSLGYCLYSAMKMNDTRKSLFEHVDMMSDHIDVDISDALIEKAVNETTSMFAACGVRELNISGLDISKIGSKKGQWMFNNCSNLEKIYVAPGTVYDNLAVKGDVMFHCDNNGTCPLKGERGTSWSNSNDKGLYCRIDDPDNGKPGYFSVAPTT